MPKWIEVEHPDVKTTARVAESALPVLAESGWKKKPEAKKTAASEKKEG